MKDQKNQSGDSRKQSCCYQHDKVGRICGNGMHVLVNANHLTYLTAKTRHDVRSRQ